MFPMNAAHTKPTITRLIAALASDNSSTRLKAALAIGSNPEQSLVDTLVARCAIEPDFYVRDMLTWALIRFPAEITVPRLLAELHSEISQARSQALHTLSKIKDAGAWPAITRSLLRDSDDEVARSAWRAAVVLVPCGQEKSRGTSSTTRSRQPGNAAQSEPSPCRPRRRSDRADSQKGYGERRSGHQRACERDGATPARSGCRFPARR